MIQPKISLKEPRQLSSEKKAEAILAGGMQEFLAHGYAGTSMDRVARAAGVSKATVYSHFQDKEGLFTALIDQLVQGKFRLLFEPSSENLQPEPRIFLHRLADCILDLGVIASVSRLHLGSGSKRATIYQFYACHHWRIRKISPVSAGIRAEYRADFFSGAPSVFSLLSATQISRS